MAAAKPRARSRTTPQVNVAAKPRAKRSRPAATSQPTTRGKTRVKTSKTSKTSPKRKAKTPLKPKSKATKSSANARGARAATTLKKNPAAERSYGGLSPVERRRDRRNRLLDAGLELFANESYANVSIERLCEVSGVTARHFYEAFESREALLLSVFGRIAIELNERVTGALARPVSDPRLRAVHGAEALIAGYLDDPRHARIFCFETLGVSDTVDQRRYDVLTEFARVIEREAQSRAEELGREVRDFRLTGVALAGATHELIAHSLMSEKPPSRKRLRRELLLIYLGLIQGYEDARETLEELGVW